MDVPDLRLGVRRVEGSPTTRSLRATPLGGRAPELTCPACGARKEDFEMVEI